MLPRDVRLSLDNIGIPVPVPLIPVVRPVPSLIPTCQVIDINVKRKMRLVMKYDLLKYVDDNYSFNHFYQLSGQA